MLELIWIVIAFCYIKLGIWTARLLARRVQRPTGQRPVKILVALVFILIPTWDILPGRLYFKHLCETEGGIKVYKQVELPAEYWDAEGRAREIFSDRPDYSLKIGERYYVKVVDQDHYIKSLRIDKETDKLLDISTGEVLAELVLFRYWGGWLVNSTGLHVSADRCPGRGIYRDFWGAVFVKGN